MTDLFYDDFDRDEWRETAEKINRFRDPLPARIYCETQDAHVWGDDGACVRCGACVVDKSLLELQDEYEQARDEIRKRRYR